MLVVTLNIVVVNGCYDELIHHVVSQLRTSRLLQTFLCLS
jgi:hypothetical protein